jgi:hypothetical protein
MRTHAPASQTSTKDRNIRLADKRAKEREERLALAAAEKRRLEEEARMNAKQLAAKRQQQHKELLVRLLRSSFVAIRDALVPDSNDQQSTYWDSADRSSSSISSHHSFATRTLGGVPHIVMPLPRSSVQEFTGPGRTRGI